MTSKLFATFQSLVSSLTIFLLLDTQFGVHLSGSNMEETRTHKQSDDKENHRERDTCKPEVADGCIDCRKQRQENEGLKNKVEKLERRLNMTLELCKLYRIKYHVT